MQQRQLGNSGPLLGALGLGLMGMSDFYGPADQNESIRTIHCALEAGTTILDTGDFYGTGHNEMLLARALQGRRREDAFISVKFGVLRSPDGGFIGLDNRPVTVKNALSHTLKRLNTDYVDLYQPARIDPTVPVEDTVGAIKDMVEDGYVRHIGLSEAGVDTVRRAHSVHPISWLQIEYSLLSRGVEAQILPALRELGIALNPYGVLSRGLLSGRWKASKDADFRSHLPRFIGENLSANLALVEALAKIAAARQVTQAQIAIAWVLAKGVDVLPLIGARTVDRFDEALGALAITLSAEDITEIEAAVPVDKVSGDRYGADQMTTLDSERVSSP